MFGWKCPPWGRAVQFSGALAILIVGFAGSASGVLADDTPIGSSEVSALGVSNPDPACLDPFEQVPPQDSLEDLCELAIGEPDPGDSWHTQVAPGHGLQWRNRDQAPGLVSPQELFVGL